MTPSPTDRRDPPEADEDADPTTVTTVTDAYPSSPKMSPRSSQQGQMASSPARKAPFFFGSLEDNLKITYDNFVSNAPPDAVSTILAEAKRLAETDILDNAIRKGDALPDFCLPDATGSMVSSQLLRQQGPLVVIFLRGGWCPYCDATVRMIRRYQPHFAARGATVVGISPELPRHNARLIEEASLNFAILSDVGNVFAKSLGIAFVVSDALHPVFDKLGNFLAGQGRRSYEERKIGDEGDSEDCADSAPREEQVWFLPVPATYVVEQGDSRKIVYSFLDSDYSKRAEPVAILNALPPLRSSQRRSLRIRLDFELSKIQDQVPEDQMGLIFKAIRNLAANADTVFAHPTKQSRILRQGDKAPDFVLWDAYDAKYNSKKLRRRGPLVIVFYRGNYCPFDNLTLEAYQCFHGKLRKQNATVLAISHQSKKATTLSATMSSAQFPLLLDREHGVAEAFGITHPLDESLVEMYGPLIDKATSEVPARLSISGNDATNKENNDGNNNTTSAKRNHQVNLAATYIIDQHGYIVDAHVEYDYTKRVEPQQVLAKVSSLGRISIASSASSTSSASQSSGVPEMVSASPPPLRGKNRIAQRLNQFRSSFESQENNSTDPSPKKKTRSWTKLAKRWMPKTPLSNAQRQQS